MANVNTAHKNESGDVPDLAGASISRQGGRSNSIGKVGVLVGALALTGVNSSTNANIMRDLSLNQSHIDRGNLSTIQQRSLMGLGGGVVSMRITAPGTSLAINYSGVAIRSFADGSGWILGTNHPVGDFTGAGFGQESITVGLAGNYITSGETRLNVSYSVPLSGSGFRDPNRRDMRLYLVESGMPQFTPMHLIAMDQVPLNSYLSFGGFGQYGSPAAGILPRSGDIRGFVSLYESTNITGGFSTAFYREAVTYNADGTGDLGRATSGYSGGGGFYLNNLCGIMSYGTNGSGFAGVNGFGFFDTQTIIEINQVTSVPAPSAIGLLGLLGVGAVVARRRT